MITIVMMYAGTNQSTSLKTDEREISLAIPAKTNVHIPTGGLMAPNVVMTFMVHPNQIGSEPNFMAIGTKIGMETKRKPMASIIAPAIPYVTKIKIRIT